MATKAPQFPMINGVAYSFASTSVVIACAATGKKYELPGKGYTAISFKRERDRGEPGRGAHPDPEFKVRGQNKYTASLKLYFSVWKYISDEVLGGAGHGDRFFSVTVRFLENGLDTTVIDIQGCTADSDGSDNAKGTDPTEIEVNLTPLKIIRDGKDDVDDPLATAA